MTNQNSVFVLIAVFALTAALASTGCASKPPLPSTGPPADFLFVYTQELPNREPALGTSAASLLNAAPRKIRVALDGDGEMEIEATYLVPHVKMEKSTHALRTEQFKVIYDAILNADLFTMRDKWDGDDQSIGRETYFVLGNARSRSIEVLNMTVPDLGLLRSAVHTYLPTLTPTSEEERDVVILDTRSMTFHAAGDPHVSAIPRQFRKKYPHQWAALDDGGEPCPLIK